MYRNFADVARACAQRGIGPAQLFLESECRLTERAPDEVRAQLRARWAVMEASARQAPEAPQRTAGGLIDGMAHRQWTYAPGQSLCGPFLNRVMARALSCSEVNASMGRICAAPTAGACGVLPAVLVSLQEERDLGWEALEGALLVASGFGAVVMRNASQAVSALLCADLALAGQVFPIPADEVVEAMRRVGRQLPPELRETAQGGIADTETGRAIAARLAQE